MNWKNLILCCSVILMTTNVAICSPLSCDWHFTPGTYHGHLKNIIMKTEKDWKMTYLFVDDDKRQGCVQFRNYDDAPFTEAIRQAFLLDSHVDIVVGDVHQIEEISYNAND